MKTSAINIRDPFIAGLHEIIMKEYGCCLCSIIGTADKDPKLLAVFLLSQFYGYRQRDLAKAYTINFHYVPTVVQQKQDVYAVSEGFREMVHEILNKLDFYESLESSRE